MAKSWFFPDRSSNFFNKPQHDDGNTSMLQRGFLLGGSTRGSTADKPKQKKSLPNSNSNDTAALKNYRTTTSTTEPPSSVTTSLKRGFLLNGSTTNKNLKPKQSNLFSKKLNDPSPSGWTKGFLTKKKKIRTKNKKTKNPVQQQQRSFQLQHVDRDNNHKSHGRKTARSSISQTELSIDAKGCDCITNKTCQNETRSNVDTCLLFSESYDANKAVDATKGVSDTAITNKSLITIISESDDNDTNSLSLLQPQQQKLENESCGREEATVEAAANTSLTSPSMLLSPFISVVKDNKNNDEKSLLTEVCTKRISKNIKKEDDEEMHEVFTETVCDDESQLHYSTSLIDSGTSILERNLKSMTVINGDKVISPVANNILQFQLELEKVFEKQQRKSSRYTGVIGSTDDIHNEVDDSQILLNIRSWTMEQNQWLWTCMLQRNLRCSHNVGTRSDITQKIFSELFDAEYRHRRDNKTNNDDSNKLSPLESILRSIETEKDRRLILEGLSVIQNYYACRRQKFNDLLEKKAINSKNPNCSIENGNKEPALLVEERSQAVMTQLIPCIADLVLMTSNGKRTQLAQSAWEIAIQLMAFRISYSLFVISVLPTKFWEQMQILIHRQILWQRSKMTKKKSTKVNDIRIHQLSKLQRNAKYMMKNGSVKIDDSFDDDNDDDDDDGSKRVKSVLMDTVMLIEKQIKII